MSRLNRGKFPLFFGLLVAIINAALILSIWASAPQGTRWLGDTVQFSSDVAVYDSYLAQGADGAILLANHYSVEPHAHRFDLFWSSAGILARSGISIILLHELLRALCTILLALAVHAVAEELLREDRDVQLATILSFGGIGFGWMYSIWLSAANLWTSRTYAAPDIATEFSIAPVLLGGAHVILSVALLLTGLRLTWRAWETKKVRTAILAALTVAALTAFHPYFGITAAIFSACCVIRFRRTLSLKILSSGAALSLIAALPAILIYLPLATDSVFREHHLGANILPLPPILSWVSTLFPFIVALVWRWKRDIALRRHEEWIIAWIFSAVICMVLPLPWTRKYLEGLGVALVLLTLPAWLALRDWIFTQRSRWLSRITASMLLLAACLTPLHLLASQLVWISPNPERATWFYATDDVFNAWDWLHVHTDEKAIILSDDSWINVWTPAYTNRTVWVGHDHETPHFWMKHALWKELIGSNTGVRANEILHEIPVDYLLLTTAATQSTFPSWLEPQWRKAHQTKHTLILERIRVAE